MDPRDIMEDLQTREYFDPKIVPSTQTIYDYLWRTGLARSKKAERILDREHKRQISDLKARIKIQRFEKAKQLILNGLNNGDLQIDDLARENISRLQALIKDLTDKIGNATSDKDKFESVKILDKVIQTLLKARILEDKPTEKTGGTIEISLHDEMKQFLTEDNEDKELE